MKREDIKEEYKWNIKSIYKNLDEYNKDFEYVKEAIPELKKYEGNFLNSSNRFLEFMSLYEIALRKIEKLSMYSHLQIDVEPENEGIQTLESRINGLATAFNESMIFVELEIGKNENKIKEILKDERCKKYSRMFNEILRYNPHKLSDEAESVIYKANSAMNSYDTYKAIKLNYEPVIINGEEHFLNDETLKNFLKNPDENIRKQAYDKVYKEYKKYSPIFAKTLEGSIKEDVFYSKVRKFNSPVESAVFPDEVTPDLFYKILKMANETYHDYFVEFIDVSEKILGKKLERYDLFLPLVKEPVKKYSLDDAFNMIFEATKNYGPEYREILEKARKERWIDYMPHEGKRLGAYSSGCYDTNPFILTSFTNDLDSVFTLIHELGHSCHTYLSNNNQEYINHDYKIFVAEVASTVNENLLLNLLISKAKTDEEKAYLLYKKLEEFIGTCYRQPLFAEFENEMHQKVSNNEPISLQVLTDTYEELNNKYYGGKVPANEFSKYSCFAIPHFYYNYYVYKYTVGYIVATVIAKRIFENDKDQIKNYLTFLKSGSTKSPVELLTLAGVNPLDDNLYKEAYQDFKKDLDEFKKITLKK